VAHPFGKSRCKKDRVCLQWLQMDVQRGYNLKSEHVLTRQHENQRLFLKEKRIFESDLFLSQAARRYGCERTPYSLCPLNKTTHFLLAPWNTRRSCQKQSGADSRKCAPTTTTHHPQAAGETASIHQDGSNSPCALSKGGSGMEASALPRSTRNPVALAS
jgi:hypothetical protein